MAQQNNNSFLPGEYYPGGSLPNGTNTGVNGGAPQSPIMSGSSPWQAGDPTQQQTADLYKQDLGRNMRPDEYQYWASRPDFTQGIYDSDEAKAYRAQAASAGQQPPTNGSTPPPQNNADISGLANNGQANSLMNTLMQRAQGSLNINPNTDPIIRPQVDNYAAQQERSRRTSQNEAAESGNPYATGAMQNTRTQLTEHAGQNTANMQSQLMQNELTSRRQEIQQALQESGSLLTSQQQLSLQRELGLLDAQLKQQQITSGNDQFTAQLGLNAQNQNNYWDSIRQGLL